MFTTAFIVDCTFTLHLQITNKEKEKLMPSNLTEVYLNARVQHTYKVQSKRTKKSHRIYKEQKGTETEMHLTPSQSYYCKSVYYIMAM